jgi:hypothetical protein
MTFEIKIGKLLYGTGRASLTSRLTVRLVRGPLLRFVVEASASRELVDRVSQDSLLLGVLSN